MVKDIQSFLGFANFYRQFIKKYSQKATPLTNLTKKEQPFQWNKEHQQAFEAIKEAFTNGKVLHIFNPELATEVETDASDGAIGACLGQQKDKKLVPVAFYSQKLTPPEQNYEIHDKELLAIVDALKQWQVYLEGSKDKVKVYSDHKNLESFTTTKTAGQILNVDADGNLAYHRQQIAATFEIADPEGENLIREALTKDRAVQDLCQVNQEPGSLFEYKDGILWFDSKTQGHQGIEQTIDKVTQHWYIPRARHKVEEYIKKCDLCQRSKHSQHAPYGQLQTVPTINQPWKTIAFDFIVKLPVLQELVTQQYYNTILVVTNKLIKYGKFVPYLEGSTAEELAYAVYKNVVADHGLPTQIITDRDKLVVSKFWQSLMDLMGVQHKLSTAYHPQTDGQTERLNQTLEQYLQNYVNYQQDNWVELLPVAQLAYNTAKNTTIGCTPFYANYGFEADVKNVPRGLQPVAQRAKVKVKHLTQLHQQLHHDIAFASQRAAKYYNNKRKKGPSLKEGDKVYLLPRNIQTKRPAKKLDHTKLGPFRIKKKLGPDMYKLQLPDSMKIHPVFHATVLEPAHSSIPIATQVPTLKLDNNEKEYNVKKVLQSRLENGELQYLVKRKGYGMNNNTWEPISQFTSKKVLQDFHRHHPEQPRTMTLQGRQQASPPEGRN
ncbi:reverse transcriptase domain protein [Lasallia pustulata]|uniref:Reverse transcriptase domain protein n=1 Tax=Lasallia pustulata TaxID=136370 RepID=A0A1W5D9G1_9LECA|nr:reverse transcriptase domain protein [Lasallia pustulata]